MKYAIVILSGASDEPLAELGRRTPLQAASMPRLSSLSRGGRVGAVATIPEGFEPTSELCALTLLGHDPFRVRCGRAACEAAAQGLDLADAFAMRLDLITIGDEGHDDAGVVLDHTGGDIPSTEADALLDDLMGFWKREAGDLVRAMEVVRGQGHRALVLDRSTRDYSDVRTFPPRSIIGESAAACVPGGGAPGAADALCQLIDSSYEMLRQHEVNLARVEQGLRPANLAWFWGQGRSPSLQSLHERFGLRGVVVGGNAVLRGLARLSGWDVAAMEAHAGPDALADAAGALLDEYDVVLVCDAGADDAAHDGDWQAKTESLERADAMLIGPVLDRLSAFGDAEREPSAPGWRAMVVVDHPTLVRTREHAPGVCPVAMGGAWIRSAVERGFSESDAATSDMQIDPGHELLEFFLRGGLARVRKEVKP